MKFIDNYIFYNDKNFFLIEAESLSTFDEEAWLRMRKSISLILSKYPFFAKLLVKLKIQQHDNLPYKTMATDGYKIYYDKDFVLNKTIDEIIFVICHEIMHNVAHHFLRTRQSYNHERWNAACDYAINQLLKGIGKMPKGVLYDPKFDGMSAEAIYESKDLKVSGNDWNIGDVQPNGSLKDGHGGYGSGNEDTGKDSKDKGEGSSIKKINDNKLKEEWSRRTSEASKSVGNGSAELDRYLKELKEPQINWRSVLKKFINTSMTKLIYKIPYKRLIHKNVYVPGPDKDLSGTSNIVFIIDTSGSISQDDLNVFNTEIKKIISTYEFENVYVISADASVGDIQTYKNSRKMKLDKLKGGGGTDFRPAFKWIDNNLVRKGKNIGFVIYFTDLYGPAPTKKDVAYHEKVMWVLINNESDEVPFGKKLKVTSKDLK